MTQIIIIEDEQSIRDNLADFLDDEGYHVKAFESGEQAIEHIKQAKPDLAIVDIRLPGMDGNEWMTQAQVLLPNLKMMVYTGSMDYKVPHELTQHQSDIPVLFKPIYNMSEFTQHITALLSP